MKAVHRTARLRRRVRQAGFTLVELMVSLVITLIMLAAILAIYLNMKTTFTAQDDIAQLQDSERLALTMLTTSIELAGYFVNPLTSTATTALPASTLTWPDGSTSSFVAGQAVVGKGDGTGAGAASDAIALQYQTNGGDGLMNCQGGTNTNPVGTTQVWVNSFSVDASNELTCAIGAGTPVPLISNVSSMVIFYGVDTQGTGVTDAYMTGAAITAANLWPNVHTARITLSFLNSVPYANGKPPPIVQTINLMNKP